MSDVDDFMCEEEEDYGLVSIISKCFLNEIDCSFKAYNLAII